jgi:hypothetical protein
MYSGTAAWPSGGDAAVEANDHGHRDIVVRAGGVPSSVGTFLNVGGSLGDGG